ncbi:MAG: S-adenosyl-l-methionine hydroxide adenosyltransferase family protein [Pseudomonadota bacterium]
MFNRNSWIVTIFSTLIAVPISMAQEIRPPLVLFSDFGTTERFVASMKGVALTVDPTLQVHDLTHHIEPHNVWQASYVLTGTIEYWPKGTVFVSVIDPGVGTKRKSVVVETATGHYIVTPDNGTLTLVADTHGIVSVREIDETINRRPGTEDLHTFHGRDVYSYTGARLAAGVIDFEGVGPLLEPQVMRLDFQRPRTLDNGTVVGSLIHVETPFGNIVTNIPTPLLEEQGLSDEDNKMVRVQISRGDDTIFDQLIPYSNSFGYVEMNEPLLYSDSLRTIGLAINSGSFAKKYGVDAGQEWTIQIAESK